MIDPQWPETARPATEFAMQGFLNMRQWSGRRRVCAGLKGLGLMAGAIMVPGCVTVAAPDKPIVIELNINIRQEVVYRLDRGVGDLIEQNSGVF